MGRGEDPGHAIIKGSKRPFSKLQFLAWKHGNWRWVFSNLSWVHVKPTDICFFSEFPEIRTRVRAYMVVTPTIQFEQFDTEDIEGIDCFLPVPFFQLRSPATGCWYLYARLIREIIFTLKEEVRAKQWTAFGTLDDSDGFQKYLLTSRPSMKYILNSHW